MSNWFYLPIGVVVGLLIYWFIYRKKKQPTPTALSAPGIHLPDPMVGHNRPDGGMFYTTGVLSVELIHDISQAIQGGLADMIAASQYHNPTWTRYSNTSDYKVFFIPPMATNQDGSPALLVGGVQSAGTVINVGPGYPQFNEPFIVLPEQASWNYLDYLKTSVHNEGEHAREWMNDPAIFYAFTGANDVHPHWSAPPTTN